MALFPRNEQLEAAIREAPDDETRWVVLEDWLLEQPDPRSELVRLEKAGAAPTAGRVRSKLATYLFGDREMKDAVGADGWRGGYAKQAEVDVPADDPAGFIERFANAPAFALIRTLHLVLTSGADASVVLRTLARAPMVAGVEALIVNAPTRHDVAIDAGWLEPFTRLQRVNFMKQGATYGPALERLSRIDMCPSTSELIALLDGEGRFEKLAQLNLFADVLDGDLTTLFAPIIDRRCARNLTILGFNGIPYSAKQDLEKLLAGRIKVY